MTTVELSIVAFVVGYVGRRVYDEITMPKPVPFPYISNIQAPTTAELNAGTYKDGAS